MPTQSVAHELVQAVRVVGGGRVQGLGARPTAARVAASLGLAGGIANTSDGLLLELEGSAGELESFLRDCRSALPAGAEIDELRSEPIMPRGLVGFEIGESDGGGARGAAVPPDQVVCPRCLAEVRDASDRRHDYAFTSWHDLRATLFDFAGDALRSRRDFYGALCRVRGMLARVSRSERPTVWSLGC